jgi:hypothetical protein
MKILRVLPYAACVVMCGRAAVSAAETPGLKPQFEAAYSLALGVSPGIGANALVRLSFLVGDPALKANLLDTAFRLAARAQHATPLFSVSGTEENTRGGSTSGALKLKVDTLSVQAEALQAMIAVDPERARKWFAAMAKPAVVVPDCEASLIADLTPYYETVLALAQRGFPPQQENESAVFAVAELARGSAIADLSPAARVLMLLEMPRPQLEAGLRDWASLMGKTPGDSRDFLFFARAIDNAVALLAERSRNAGIQPESLIGAYRQFLVKQLHTARCTDTGLRARIPPLAGLFGEGLRGQQPPISEEELMPTSFQPGQTDAGYWETSQGSAIYEEGQRVRESKGQAQRLNSFLAMVENWNESEGTPEDRFHQKAIAYETLLDEGTPPGALPGALGDRVIESFVRFLTAAELKQQNPVEWLFRARKGLDLVRKTRPAQTAKILAAYRSSGVPTLMLEALLEESAPLDSSAKR